MSEMAKPLTERQQRVVDAIQGWITEHGFPPTIRELGKQLGIKSLRGVTTHLDALAKKGHLVRKRGARSVRLLTESASRAAEHLLRVPILGRIAAGQLLLAEEHREGELILDASLIGKTPLEQTASHFALRVSGRSMQGAGILHGDYVIVRQQPTADNGEIVVAMAGEETTVKRFFKEDEGIRLQPDNPAMEPMFFDKNHPVEILGKVVAVFRKLA